MTTLDTYVTIGRSGLRVSPLTLGTMTFGEDSGWGASVDVSEAILAAYLEAGGNSIDTANIYTNGHSEKIIGDYLAARPGMRDRVVIGTKFFANLHPGDPNGGGGGRKAILASLDASLRRLQTDYVDLYWLHGWDRHAPIDETLRSLDDLVTAGKVRYIGLSDVPAWVAARAQTVTEFRGWVPVTALQLEYSLLERTVEGQLLPMADALGMGVLPWSPLRGGQLSGKYVRGGGTPDDSPRANLMGVPAEHDWAVIESLIQIAGELQVAPAQVALAWVRQQAGVDSTIIGARTLEQLRSNLASFTLMLTAEQQTILNAVSTPKLNFPAPIIEAAHVAAFGGTTVDGVQYPIWPALQGSPARY